jgi:hypothetical protein
MTQDLTPAAQRLHAYIMDGLLSDIVVARESYGLLRKLGEHSAALLASTYGHFFDALDRSLLNNYLLAIARMYDRPSKQFEVRSVPSALAFIRQNAEYFPVLERHALEARLAHAGMTPGEFAALSDDQLTLAVLEYFERKVPRGGDEAATDLSRALHAVQARRNKRVAHSEYTPSELFPKVTWAEAEALVRFAEDAISSISFGYLRLALSTDDGTFMLEGDAGRAPRALERMLRAAGVLADSRSPAA